MPDPSNPRHHPHPAHSGRPREASPSAPACEYAELHCLSNFSFQHGASHPEELVAQAAALGYCALAITDLNSLAGVVRAHLAARENGLRLLIGAHLTPVDAPPVVLLAPDRAAYGRLARLITRSRLRSPKGACELHLDDIAQLAVGLIALLPGAHRLPDLLAGSHAGPASAAARPGIRNFRSLRAARFRHALDTYRSCFGENLFLAAELDRVEPDDHRIDRLIDAAQRLGLPLAASNAVRYHVPERRCLHDVITCIRCKCTLAQAGRRLAANAERHLRPLEEIAARYARIPDALARTVSIARRCTFALDELRYQYPREIVPPGMSAAEYLARLTWRGACERYGVQETHGDLPTAQQLDALPQAVRKQIEAELALIAELKYEAYFLTVYDLVRFARSRGILCQGRGSAANSAVCYCLGVTAVDPARIDVLFERFISRERNEPPDIDIDFEHERREEVFQYIYAKYGRERAAITAEVITYRPRLAIRDVGKALGFSLDRLDALARSIDWYMHGEIPGRALALAGLDASDRTVQLLLRLVREILGFPRHLSQHVGGFVITETPLCEIVPLENGAMPDRTFIEWDKDDIDALGLLKVDCLALGMLTAIQKCFLLLAPEPAAPQRLEDIPSDDARVYDMICAADTIGVFQIESRAQQSMLPRLRPRRFYDLVIEVAIVRPGPIQGGMVHPYLRRRNGEEPVRYPSEAVRGVLQKTLGVPLFQEQAMKLAVVAAGFTPGEADQLRRAMAAWRRGGQIEKFKVKLIRGMLENGYTKEFAEQLYSQICGFGEYGFPESHAASFALLVWASCWLKYHYPAAFCAAMLNSQPLGFYTPGQLVRDAMAHGVSILAVDINHSRWDCSLESVNGPGAVRLGMRLVRGLNRQKVQGIEAARAHGPVTGLAALARRPDVSRDTLLRLAAADAFRSLGLSRRQAIWQILAMRDAEPTLFDNLDSDNSRENLENPRTETARPRQCLPEPDAHENVVEDYDAIGLSLRGHPIGLVRRELAALGAVESRALKAARRNAWVRVAGLVTVRQRPGTARGVVFMTLEDEHGMANLIIRPNVWEREWEVARNRIALLAEGTIERQGEVVHVMVRKFHDLTERLREVQPFAAENPALREGPRTQLKHRSRDFH